MSIPLSRYVNITSGVGAATSVAERELIGRYITTNPLLPTGTFEDFTSAESVGDYFGTTSEEYVRALFSFGWTSKNITAVEKMSFARWADQDTAPQIFGAKGPQSLGTWNAISSGAFTLEMGGVSHSLTAMDFSAAANLAAVAAIIQAKIRTQATAQWTNATVVWNSVRSSFDMTGGSVGAATISVVAGAGGSDIAAQLGWLSPNAIFSKGAALQTISQVLTQTSGLSDNFGSFAFLPSLSNDQIVEAAEWNRALNVKFLYSVPVLAANAVTLEALVGGIGGTGLTLDPDISGEFPEMMPMMIEAATNYAAPNSTQNFEFQFFDITPSVFTQEDADTYDALRINYYGQTQNAGRLVQFYQQGLMMGLAVDPADMNTYANEQWLKDAAGAAILTLLLALAKVSANSTGRSQLISTMNPVLQQALLNGTISVGKPLDQVQKLYIGQITNDPNAWYQVQNDGYWFDVVITPYTVGSVKKYKAVYTLVYSKDDIIRLVEGRDILI